jgi:hypothetical protein
LDGFARLLELNGIPDIRVALESGSIALPELWNLRQKRIASRFRKWLVGNTSAIQSLPARTLRFALTTTLGTMDPVAGVVVGAIDSFFVEKYLSGFRPKLMFDEIRKILPPAAGT